jgi:RNA polymerase subunit RPABC4/transcription elongation factor Spt4
MSYIGINEYVISMVDNCANNGYYAGTVGTTDNFSSELSDAKRYTDTDLLREDLEKLPLGNSYRILEIQRCPKCHREFTEYPAISRKDNETEICPGCGLREAMEAFMGEKGIEADA